MKNTMVKIMVEVLDILGTTMKEVKQSQASELCTKETRQADE